LIKADNSPNIETEKKKKTEKKQTNKQKRRLVFFSFGDMKGWLDGLPEREMRSLKVDVRRNLQC
jgi:hypothetical protein